MIICFNQSFRKVKKLQEKLCNTVIGRELTECHFSAIPTTQDAAITEDSSSTTILGKKFFCQASKSF